MILNDSELRELALSAPESKRPIAGGGRVKTAALPWQYTREEMDHWSDTSKTAMYFLLRQMGYSPRQIAASSDLHLADPADRAARYWEPASADPHYDDYKREAAEDRERAFPRREP